MRILITGSGGLIGKRLCAKLGAKHKIIRIDREHSKSIEYLNLIDYNEPIDVIIHMSSNCVIRDIIANPKLAFENVWSHFNIYELARKVGCKKVVYFSSSRVTHHEDNLYIASKKFGENLAHSYKNCYGIDNLIIRPETVWAMDDKKNRVITNWISSALEGKPIKVYGDRNKELSPIHADDFVESFLKVFKLFLKGKNLKNLYAISGKVMTVQEIITIIKLVTESLSKVEYLDSEQTQPQKCVRVPDIISDNFEQNVRDEIDEI